DVFADCLFAKVRRSVDEDTAPFVLDHDRRARPPIAWIAGVADGACTPDGGHAHRRTASQHGERRPHFLIGPGPAGGFTAAVARAFVISTQAILSSNNTFCSRVCSRSARLPLVFSCKMLIESMVCLAPMMSTAGGSPS